MHSDLSITHFLCTPIPCSLGMLGPMMLLHARPAEPKVGHGRTSAAGWGQEVFLKHISQGRTEAMYSALQGKRPRAAPTEEKVWGREEVALVEAKLGVIQLSHGRGMQPQGWTEVV